MGGRNKVKEQHKYLFHIGGVKHPELSSLLQEYTYQYFEIHPQLKGELAELQPLTPDQVNNSAHLFLLSRETMPYLKYLDLVQLPSHQVFYETLEGATEEEVGVLKLKGAQHIDFSQDIEYFARFINDNYVKPWGTSIDQSRVEINSNFRGSLTKKGASMYELEGDFGIDYEQILLFKNQWNASGRTHFYPEMEASEELSYFWRVYYKNDKEVDTISYRDISPEEIQSGQVTLNLGFSVLPVNFGLFVKGQGRVCIGALHIRYGLAEEHFLAMGGKRLVSSMSMGEELGYYFNAGDLQPPLNIYFSGYRPSEGYEGRWMMGSLGAPFILVYDPRLVGGSFYRGAGLEEQLLNVIQEKLNLLGFSNKELILSGLSMGTYASFYYGARLEPHAIIVGKPLANIGNLAVHARIFSPYDWDLAMDTIVHLTGQLTESNARKLDSEFWQQFEAADFSETTFLMAHMLQDTDLPFQRIFNYLKKNFPTSKILHKGIEGRHNDDTKSVTSWFYKQFQQLLISDFKRKFVNDEENEEIDLRGEDDE